MKTAFSWSQEFFFSFFPFFLFFFLVCSGHRYQLLSTESLDGWNFGYHSGLLISFLICPEGVWCGLAWQAAEHHMAFANSPLSLHWNGGKKS